MIIDSKGGDWTMFSAAVVTDEKLRGSMLQVPLSFAAGASDGQNFPFPVEVNPISHSGFLEFPAAGANRWARVNSLPH